MSKPRTARIGRIHCFLHSSIACALWQIIELQLEIQAGSVNRPFRTTNTITSRRRLQPPAPKGAYAAQITRLAEPDSWSP